MKKMLTVMAMGLMTTLGSYAEETEQRTDNPAETLSGDSIMNASLKELTVKGTLPKTRVRGDAMRTIVNGSVLEQTTSATEMLKYLPNVKAESGSVSVIGRGDAEVYVNGRKVQDLKELDQIRPGDIQFVDVVSTPGARYSASTRAVIRITMKRPQGEGFGFTNTAYAAYQFDWTLQDQIDMNYRKGGLDVTGSLTGTTYSVGQDQVLTIRSMAGSQVMRQVGKDDTKGRVKMLYPKLQLNYVVDKNHSFGAWYQYGYMPYQHTTAHLNTQIFLGDAPQERTISDIYHDWQVRKHMASLYYNGQFGQWNVDFNADGVWADNKMPIETTEETQMGGASNTIVVHNDNDNQMSLYAAKLVVSRPLLGGSLSFGGEFGHSRQGYQYYCLQHIVPDMESEVQENIGAGFLEYSRQFGKLTAIAGLRYEHARNKYYEWELLQEDQSRKYNDIFPSVTMAMPVGKAQFSLSYKQDITRPDYQSLNNNLMYVNRYTFQSGNPMLRPTYAHNVVLNGAYKWATLMASFSRTKDAMSVLADAYPANPDITLMHSENIETYNNGNLSLTFSPVIRQIWRPQMTLGLEFQNYRAQRLDGSFFHLNHPVATIQWQNFISLPKGFLFMPSFVFNSKGDTGNIHINDCICSMAFSLRKSFLKNKLDVTLNATDPFELADSNVTLYGGREMSTNVHKLRSFYAHVVYRFNESRSKYKGTGAGEAQKARMRN